MVAPPKGPSEAELQRKHAKEAVPSKEELFLRHNCTDNTKQVFKEFMDGY